MNAVISGRAGVAILVEGDGLFSIDVNEPEIRVSRRADDAWRLLGDAQDLRFVEDIAIEQVLEQLEEETSADEALHWALILLDAEHEGDLRAEAAAVLERLLASDAVVRTRLEAVLSARPMPAEMDRVGAIGIGRRIAAGAVVGLLEGLSACQAAVTDVWAAWDAIPVGLFGGSDERKQALAQMVREGIFRDLVGVRASGGSVDALVATALKRAAVRTVHNHGEILARWSRAIVETVPEELAVDQRTAFDALEASAPRQADIGRTWLGQLEERGLVHVDWEAVIREGLHLPDARELPLELAKAERNLAHLPMGGGHPVPPSYPRRAATHELFRPKAAA